MSRKSGLTITCSSIYIKNSWIRDGLSEFLATFVFGALLTSAAAQEVLLGWHQMSVFSLNVMAGLSLAMAIYVAGNASGSYVNPGIALMFALKGKLKWKKYPMYVAVELLGMYAGCGIVYLIYMDDITNFESGLKIVASNSTASIFSTFPKKAVDSKASLFFEVALAHFLLVLLTMAIIDPDNMGVVNGLAPIPIGISVIVICGGFATNTGCPINPAKDFAARIFLVTVGYGSDVFSYGHYWFWVSPVACLTGSLVATLVYQFMVGLQWTPKARFQRRELEFDTIKEHDMHNGE